MNLVKKTVVALIILSFFSLHLPMSCLSLENIIYAKADVTAPSIKKHTPEFLALPEKKIPVGPRMPGEKIENGKMNNWLWVGLGALAVGALAAGLSGGNGDGGGENVGPSTGDITIKWND